MGNIPFTIAPVHDTQDGDSFAVAAASGTSASSEPHNANEDQSDDKSPPDPDDDSDMPSPSLAASDNIHTGVHIHRLGHQQSHGRLRWDTIDSRPCFD